MHEIWGWISAAMADWHQSKLFVEHSLAVEHDALHLITGVLLWLAIAWLLRKPLSAWAPFLWMFAIIVWNEAVDFWVEIWPDPGQQLGESFKDLILTILVPGLLMLLIRTRPQMFVNGSKKRKR